MLLTYWVIIQPNFHQKNREKKWYKKVFNVEKRDRQYVKMQIIPKRLLLLGLGIASFFIGTGIGSGLKTANKLKNNTIKLRDKIEFTDGKELEVNIIGQNSNYIFYVEKRSKIVTIVPISGNVKKIKRNIK